MPLNRKEAALLLLSRRDNLKHGTLGTRGRGYGPLYMIVLITSSDELVGKTGNHLHHAISRDEEEARESTRIPQMIDFWISAAPE